MDKNHGSGKKYATAWMEVTRNGDIGFFERQFKTPYRNTVAFCDWLKSSGCLAEKQACRVADAGAGMGGALYYLSTQFPNVDFTGIEINPELVDRGQHKMQKLKVKNIRLVVGNIYRLGNAHRDRYKGVISMQTLHVLPDFQAPLQKMMDMIPDWIAFSTLLYDGPINSKIETHDYTMPTKGKPYNQKFHNVYSIDLVRKFMKDRGYGDFSSKPFEIDVDLPKPKTGGFGTYTVKTQEGKRLMVSGPLLMNWHFVTAKRTGRRKK